MNIKVENNGETANVEDVALTKLYDGVWHAFISTNEKYPATTNLGGVIHFDQLKGRHTYVSFSADGVNFISSIAMIRYGVELFLVKDRLVLNQEVTMRWENGEVNVYKNT